MTHSIAWLPDGTPYSTRFDDRYHGEQGLEQARSVFLHGCGLPAAWAGAQQWRILETGFGFGLNFLATWAAWRAVRSRANSAFTSLVASARNFPSCFIEYPSLTSSTSTLRLSGPFTNNADGVRPGPSNDGRPEAECGSTSTCQSGANTF